MINWDSMVRIKDANLSKAEIIDSHEMRVDLISALE